MMYGILIPSTWDHVAGRRRWKLARNVFGPFSQIEKFLIEQQFKRPRSVTICAARIVPLPMYGEPS